MSAIRQSGGKGGGGLRKVNDLEKKDRSGAFVPGAANESSGASGGGGGGGAPQGGLAGALQDALAKRKQKVSGSGTYYTPLSLITTILTQPQMTRKRTMTSGERILATEIDSSGSVLCLGLSRAIQCQLFSILSALEVIHNPNKKYL